MWERLLAVNTFVIAPLTGLFFVYGLGRTFLYGEWRLLAIGAALFALALLTEVVLGILSA